MTLSEIKVQFGFVQGDSVVAKIKARNEIGWSDYSQESDEDVLIVD
jgi:hypothetical protein